MHENTVSPFFFATKTLAAFFIVNCGKSLNKIIFTWNSPLGKAVR